MTISLTEARRLAAEHLSTRRREATQPGAAKVIPIRQAPTAQAQRSGLIDLEESIISL